MSYGPMVVRVDVDDVVTWASEDAITAGVVVGNRVGTNPELWPWEGVRRFLETLVQVRESGQPVAYVEEVGPALGQETNAPGVMCISPVADETGALLALFVPLVPMWRRFIEP